MCTGAEPIIAEELFGVGLMDAATSAAGVGIGAGAFGAGELASGALAGAEGLGMDAAALSGLDPFTGLAPVAAEAAAPAAGAVASRSMIDPALSSLVASGEGGSAISGGSTFGTPLSQQGLNALTPASMSASGSGAGAGTIDGAIASAAGQGAPAISDAAINSGTYMADQAAAVSGAQPPAQPSWLDKGLKAITPTNALTAAGLGMNAMNQQKIGKAMGDMQSQLKGAVAPLQGPQANLIAQYNSGQLNQADAQGIQDWVTAEKAKIEQSYASMGTAASPQKATALAAIDQKATAMHDQALQNYLSGALATTGAITGAYGTIANQQLAQDSAFQQALRGTGVALGQGVGQSQGQPAATP